MASAKEYGYFIKGSKLALIEKDTALDNDVNSRDYGPDVTNVRFKSPQSSVTDGIELEYAYSPKYRLGESIINMNIFAVHGWTAVDGYLAFVRTGMQATTDVTDWTDAQYNIVTSGSSGDTGGQSLDYIVVRGSDRWNGLHRVQTATSDGILKTYTKIDVQLPGHSGTSLDFSTSELIWNEESTDPRIWLADQFSAGDFIFISGSAAVGNNGLFDVASVTESGVVPGETVNNVEVGNRYYFLWTSSDTYGEWDLEQSAAAAFTAESDQTDIGFYKIIHEPNTKIYTDIDVLNDEADELPLTEYLSKAVVYYLKAKTAEDQGNFQLKDVMMREFYRIVEKSDNAKIHTIRRVAPHSAAIR